MSGQLTAENIRAEADSLIRASQVGVSAGIFHPFMALDLMQQGLIACLCCRNAAEHEFSGGFFCGGCWFRYQVARASGREKEFMKGLER